MKRLTRKLYTLKGDLAGGFAATLIAIPQAMSLGILVFAALGPEYASAGVVAALFASVVGNLIAVMTGTMRCQIFGARASATAMVAALVAALAANPLLQGSAGPDVPVILAVVSLTVLLSGLFQLGFGFAGFGRAIKFVPYPVIAGFMSGIALIILASQLRPALGLPGYQPITATLAQLGEAKPGSVAVASLAMLAVMLAPRMTRRIPALLCGLFVGIAVHYLLALVAPTAVGPVVGELPAAIAFWPQEIVPMLDLARGWPAGALVALVLPSAILLAAVSALDGLLAATVVDTVTRGKHDSDRLLVGQGLASVALAAFGAVPVVANAHTPVASFLAGGRTPASTLFHAIFMLAVMLAFAPLVARVPVAALAGLMIYIAFTLMDSWTQDLLRRLRSDDEHRAEILVNVAIVIVVAFAQLLFNVMVAFTIGVVAAVTLLLVKLSGSPVRRRLDGTMRSSHKIRGPAARAALAGVASRIQVLELQGELFFGTADRLQVEIESLPEGTQFVILDFRRVHQIDASGARMLEMIAHRAARRDVHLVMSHLREDEPRGRYLHTLGLAEVVGPRHWFTDLDRALEWVEDRLLERLHFVEELGELPPERLAFFEGMDAADVAEIAACLERQELTDGDVVFLEGDVADCAYLIAQGAVSIKVSLDDKLRARRLATFIAGVTFGEMALLEGARRSADAFAKGERVVLFKLAASTLAAIVERNPHLGLKIHQRLSRELAGRLRATTEALRAIE